MERRVTIQDIATIAEVSKSTVSRYLNHGYVSEEKAERIQQAIAATGFSSNAFARRLKAKKSGVIGIVMPRVDSPTGGKLLTGIAKAFDEVGCRTLFESSFLEMPREIKSIEHLAQLGADGIVVHSLGITTAHHALVETLKERDVPVLFVGQQDENVKYIKVDDFGAGRLLGDYIRRMGHERVVFVGVTEKDRAVGVERKDGFSEIFTRGNRGASVSFVETEFGIEASYHKSGEILARRPSAVVCATDGIAFGVMRALHENGIAVPGEVSVAGFGGYDMGAVTYPPLTTVAFDYEELGRRAARMLLRMLSAEIVESVSDFPAQLIERGSVNKVLWGSEG